MSTDFFWGILSGFFLCLMSISIFLAIGNRKFHAAKTGDLKKFMADFIDEEHE